MKSKKKDTSSTSASSSGKSLRVIKVPLGYTTENFPVAFARMPVLYLELLENKDKVKKEFKNKDYIPDVPGGAAGGVLPSSLSNGTMGTTHKSENSVENKPESKAEIIFIEDVSTSKRDAPHEEERRSQQPLQSTQTTASTTTQPSMSSRPPPSQQQQSVGNSSGRHTLIPQSPERDESERKSSNRATNELASILTVSSSAAGLNSGQTPVYQTSQLPTSQLPSPPLLSELKENRHVKIGDQTYRDLNRVSRSDEDEDIRRRDYDHKFHILRKKYADAVIPEITRFTPLSTIEAIYNDTVRKVTLDASVENTKQFLIMGLLGFEFVLTSFFKLDAEGFMRSQMLKMNSYNDLLVELGAKSYLQDGFNLPVEIKLMGMILINAAMFVGFKHFTKSSGLDLNSILSNKSAPPPGENKKKMQGPKIDLK